MTVGRREICAWQLTLRTATGRREGSELSPIAKSSLHTDHSPAHSLTPSLPHSSYSHSAAGIAALFVTYSPLVHDVEWLIGSHIDAAAPEYLSLCVAWALLRPMLLALQRLRQL